jgi:hypothetical protein
MTECYWAASYRLHCVLSVMLRLNTTHCTIVFREVTREKKDTRNQPPYVSGGGSGRLKSLGGQEQDWALLLGRQPPTGFNLRSTWPYFRDKLSSPLAVCVSWGWLPTVYEATSHLSTAPAPPGVAIATWTSPVPLILPGCVVPVLFGALNTRPSSALTQVPD